MKVESKKYHKLLGPRLTVCVSTLSPEGTPNVAPYSFVTPLSFKPPLLGFSTGGQKDTFLNAVQSKEFVIAPLTSDWAEKGIRSEISLSREQSEFDRVGLTPSESKAVSPPSIREAPINIECKYWDHFETGDHFLVVGEVVHIAADQDALEDGTINVERLRPVGHISGETFCVADGIERIQRKGH